ncbi:hypothetical protein SERLA73DRAFT_188420 [Serpula lacrymans var. lacrymans S7.3]|uniref:Uncharacterized protein n=1 Tax=Serpula lacrymans var. lacrymans (strain S7.3) TaxID=936435 RepID=F8QBA6_SERL3|nr:hypothetical protein SERLA73DRAFT_188420 [Serpula lacrymans var. lacrymans S7.3]
MSRCYGPVPSLSVICEMMCCSVRTFQTCPLNSEHAWLHNEPSTIYRGSQLFDPSAGIHLNYRALADMGFNARNSEVSKTE